MFRLYRLKGYTLEESGQYIDKDLLADIVQKTNYGLVPRRVKFDKDRLSQLVYEQFPNVMQLAKAATGLPTTHKLTLYKYNVYRRLLQRGTGYVSSLVEIAKALGMEPRQLFQEIRLEPWEVKQHETV